MELSNSLRNRRGLRYVSSSLVMSRESFDGISKCILVRTSLQLTNTVNVAWADT